MPRPPVQSKYAVLTQADIKRRQKEAVDSVTSILGIAAEDAERILRKYKWCATTCAHLQPRPARAPQRI